MEVLNRVFNGDNVKVMEKFPDNIVDLVITSPPYDDLRNYGGLSWDLYGVIKQLKRILVVGGVVVWVVADQTINGSETGSSFKQAIAFMEGGFNLHDTAIYRKLNFFPLTHNRYEQEFEYMFMFSKGTPKTFNPIMEKAVIQKNNRAVFAFYDKDGKLVKKPETRVSNNGLKIKGNIFAYHTGKDQTSKIKHPAVFPRKLAEDQIISWTNKGDVVMDIFSGSGTTIKAARELERNFIGIEKNKIYFTLSLNKATNKVQRRFII